MTTTLRTFENGTQGATATSALIGTRTGYPLLNGGSCIFDAGVKATGAFGLKIISAANNNTVALWDDTQAAGPIRAWREVLTLPSINDTTTGFAWWSRRWSGGTVITMRYSAGGALEVSTNNQTTFTVLKTAGSFTMGGQYDFSVRAILGGSGTNGGLSFIMRTMAGVEVGRVELLGNASIGTNNFTAQMWGQLSTSSPAGITMGLDNAQTSDDVIASTLASAAAAAATTISVTTSIPVGALLGIDTGTATEVRQVSAVTGSGPYTLTLSSALSSAHASGAAVSGLVELAPVTASAPTANAGADQVLQAGSQVNFTGASVSSGSAAWTCTGKPDGAADPTINNSASLTNASAVNLVAGVYTFRLTATDGALSGFDDVQVFAYPATGVDVKPRSAVSNSFINSGGAANLVAALADSLPTTFAESSPGSGVTQTLRATMNPYGPGVISISAPGYDSGGDVLRVITVYKEDGSTVVYTDAQYGVPSLVTTTLSAAAASGATTITTALALTVGAVVTVEAEVRRVASVAGNVATLDSALSSAHASGAAVTAVPDHSFTLDAGALAKIPTVADRKALIVEIADTGV